MYPAAVRFHDADPMQFALGIITRCGFGLPYHWTASGGGGGEMSFEEALHTVSENAVIRLATPAWAYKLPIKRYVPQNAVRCGHALIFYQAADYRRGVLQARRTHEQIDCLAKV